MINYEYLFLILFTIFIQPNFSLWSCVDDKSTKPIRYFCSALHENITLFYISPVFSTRLSVTVISNNITQNSNKGFNWRTVNSTAGPKLCESVESLTSLGSVKLRFVCLFPAKMEGNYPVEIKLSKEIVVAMKLIIESGENRTGNVFLSDINYKIGQNIPNGLRTSKLLL